MRRLTVALGDIGRHGLGERLYGHGLQGDPAGAGDDGVEEAFAAEQLVLQALGVLKTDDTAGAYLGDLFYANNAAAERSFYCGGTYTSGANAGVFSLYGYYARSHSYASLGFRSAFVELPTA